MKDISEKVIAEDIKAEVEKTESRLIFSGLVLLMVLIGFWVRTCSKMPPSDTNNSVECTRIGGKWIPETYKEIKDYDPKRIEAYCSSK